MSVLYGTPHTKAHKQAGDGTVLGYSVNQPDIQHQQCDTIAGVVVVVVTA